MTRNTTLKIQKYSPMFYKVCGIPIYLFEISVIGGAHDYVLRSVALYLKNNYF